MFMRILKRNIAILTASLALNTISIPIMAQINTDYIDVGKGKSWENYILVPYVDVDDMSFNDIEDMKIKTQVNRYNLGFVVADEEGEPIWLEDRLTKEIKKLDKEVAKELNRLRGIGIDAMISFGGPLGTPLYEVESNAKDLKNTYKYVVRSYGVTAADFYMQGANFTSREKRQIKTNIDALVALKKEMPQLEMLLTFEVEDNEVSDDVLEMIEYAVEEGVDFKGINFVIKEYDLYRNDASDVTKDVLKDVFPYIEEMMPKLKEQEVWAKMGVTPIIDDKYTFDERDAKEVAQFAVDKGLGYVSYYHIGNDERDYSYAQAFSKYLVDYEAPEVPIYLEDVSVSHNQVTLRWDIKSNTEVPTSYKVYRQRGNEKMVKLVGETKERRFTDKAISPDTTYTYYVTALDQAGNESGMSKPIKITTDKEKEDNGLEIGKYKGHWRAGARYNVGDIVKFKNAYYTCLQKHESVGGWQPAKASALWEKISWDEDDLEDIEDELEDFFEDWIEDYIKNNKGNKHGFKWEEGRKYEAGDFIYYKGKWYNCVQSHTVDDAKWSPDKVLALWETFDGDYEDLEEILERFYED